MTASMDVVDNYEVNQLQKLDDLLKFELLRQLLDV